MNTIIGEVDKWSSEDDIREEDIKEEDIKHEEDTSKGGN